jgi:hypothetical protein
VAAAIVDALQFPRLEVFVPKYLGGLNRVTRALPRRFGEWLLTRSGSDDLLASAAHSSARSEYERRAAASAPATEGPQ